MTSKAEEALRTVKRVLDEAPDHVVAELWVDDRTTLGAFVDMSLGDLTPPPVQHALGAEAALNGLLSIISDSDGVFDPCHAHHPTP